MAKRKRALPARKPRDRSRDEESRLLRSAESLGRLIASVQRQLNVATKRLSETAGEAWETIPSLPGGKKATRRGTKKRRAASKSAGAKKARKAKSVARKKTRRR